MKKKFFIFIGIVILICMLDHQLGWSSYLADFENIKFLRDMVKDNIWLASIIYIVLTIVGCVVLCLPGITFALFGGMLFGPVLGILLCLIATTIGASLAFLVGRFFLKDTVKPMVEKNKYLKKILFDESGKSDLILLMVTRMLPIFPYNLQNFAYGITDIDFWKYTSYTFIFMLPGVAFITIGAAGITAGENKWMYFTISALLLVGVLVLGSLIQKKYLGEREKQPN
ncbi:TVP38/TMEM64 family protein [Clostridium cylindrosporum]|uniref:TVP38/TMEM64 family membrane protein n=1 Tax=Clostridium cylindrosporum DSM 605 TaxID=1121307 RepID=A0A0J8DE36_CLOCY|nr:TVP38/TMEM64 family protein [Clostridium cylindrosporum]KMT22484.1 SNARE-like domain protein [Clostridium cylindrosporum DSM 605]